MTQPAGTDPSREDSAPPSASASRKSRNDRRAKILLVVVVLVAAYFLYKGQVKPPEPPDGWGSNLQDALAAGAEDNRMVVVAFVPNGRSETTDRLREALGKQDNLMAIQAGGYLAVWLPLTDAYAQKYEVNPVDLPVTLILSPQGQVLKRAKGNVGEVPFRQEFLILPEDSQ